MVGQGITVYISTDSSRRRLQRCIESLRSQALNPSVPVRCEVKFWTDGPNRGLLLAQTDSGIVLYLDADCSLPDEGYLDRLITLIESRPAFALFGGDYMDEPRASYLDHGYNQLCNLWVANTVSRDSGETKHLLGGCLAIVKSRLNQVSIPAAEESWGAEDTRLVRNLIQQGARAYFDQRLSVFHSPDNTIGKTLRRAWIHGRRRQEHQLRAPLSVDAVSPKGLRKILIGLPFVILHMVVVSMGSAYQSFAGTLSTKEVRTRSP